MDINDKNNKILAPYQALKDIDKKDISECINRIMNTLSFRKLAGKTQVILSLTGPDVRTRLTHTIEVSRIARDICTNLGLNADLAEAIALAHDIGHTPFGHVGERTLREIMCGCDTLKEKVNELDFENMGFKHNIQSFRVLKNFEKVTDKSNDNQQKIWRYILWGVVAHSKLTWAKPCSGMDDEIRISSKHCDWVYVCHYHKKKECKWNVQDKKKRELKTGNEICMPWYCANLPIVSNKDEVETDDLNPGETRRDYAKKRYINQNFQKNIFCSRKCYLATLWEYRIEKNNISTKHPYLFDHPFPNTFYAKYLDKYFFDNDHIGGWHDYISLEAIIVSQADEIAQRQQDLEDGINKGLISLKDAKEYIVDLIYCFTDNDQIRDLFFEIDDIKNSEELGKLLVDFYKKLIILGTEKNFKKFTEDSQQLSISSYSLLHIIYSMNDNLPAKAEWILQELNNGPPAIESDIGNTTSNPNNNSIFNTDFEIAYLYLMVYDYLENSIKRSGYSKELVKMINSYTNHLIKTHKEGTKLKGLNNDQINKCSEKLTLIERELKQINDYFNKIADIEKILQKLVSIDKQHICIDGAREQINIFQNQLLYSFIKVLKEVRDYLKIVYSKECGSFFVFDEKKQTLWINIGGLRLPHFHAIYKAYNGLDVNEKTICTKEIEKFDYNINDYKPVAAFHSWKKILKHDANKVLSNIVTFIYEDDPTWKDKNDALKKFEEMQRDTILKSETVEKNDGKAKYILTRLFKAYITNSHQMSDVGLKFIIIALMENDIWAKLKKSEEKTFFDILEKIEKTIVNKIEAKEIIEKIKMADFMKIASDKEDNFEELKKGTSNEIKAALENRKKLYKFFSVIENGNDIQKLLISEEYADREILKEIIRKFRAVLDNPCLNPTPFWKSILTRGICDYIASLTDQEAINEYEKLYAGVMELV